jgi:hypothetical protein
LPLLDSTFCPSIQSGTFGAEEEEANLTEMLLTKVPLANIIILLGKICKFGCWNKWKEPKNPNVK